MRALVPLILLSTIATAQQPTILKVAGGDRGFSGDGGPAEQAKLKNPTAVVVDSRGVLYIADRDNHRIRRVDPLTRTITTLAGNGKQGFAGDGGPAEQASLAFPSSLALDSAGNLFIADTQNNRIRRVDAVSSIITTVAGNGIANFEGDGGPATQAGLDGPQGVAVDRQGNIYIADTGRFDMAGTNRVRRVDAQGVITTVAGSGAFGSEGDGGPATNASLTLPRGVASSLSGDFFIADTDNNRVRRVDTQGVITTVAGTGLLGYTGDGVAAVTSALGSPISLVVDAAGNLFIADRDNNRVRRVDTQGVITTVAGNGRPGSQGDLGPAAAASLNSPYGVALDEAGNLFIADSANNRVRMVLAATSHSDSPRILEALYKNNRLTISGSGFGFAGAAVSINGRDITTRVTGQSGVEIVLKGNRKKLGLAPGSEIIVTCNGASSNTFIFK